MWNLQLAVFAGLAAVVSCCNPEALSLGLTKEHYYDATGDLEEIIAYVESYRGPRTNMHFDFFAGFGNYGKESRKKGFSTLTFDIETSLDQDCNTNVSRNFCRLHLKVDSLFFCKLTSFYKNL